MYLIERLEGEKARSLVIRPRPFGPGLKPDARVEFVEVWGSSFNDPGDDWCEFRMFAADDQELGSYRFSGY